MKVWVLTEEVNDYDQHGEYFIKVWSHKPSNKELVGYVCGHNWENEEAYEHVLNGGGRRNFEYNWYHLIEHDV